VRSFPISVCVSRYTCLTWSQIQLWRGYNRTGGSHSRVGSRAALRSGLAWMSLRHGALVQISRQERTLPSARTSRLKHRVPDRRCSSALNAKPPSLNCPFRIRCSSSMPAIVIAAFLNSLTCRAINGSRQRDARAALAPCSPHQLPSAANIRPHRRRGSRRDGVRRAVSWPPSAARIIAEPRPPAPWNEQCHLPGPLMCGR